MRNGMYSDEDPEREPHPITLIILAVIFYYLLCRFGYN